MSGTTNNGSGAELATVTELLASLPDRKDITASDISGLGILQGTLEQAAEKGIPKSLHNILKRMADLVSDIILDDISDREKATDAVFTAISTIIGSSGDTDKIAENARQAILPFTDENEGETKEKKKETPLPVDTVTINSDEDYIIYNEFITESGEHLDNIESRVLELENSGFNADIVNDMFRCFHSMKGAAGFLGLTAVNNLCHEVENMLDRARKMTLQIDRDVIDVLLASIDMAKHLLEGVRIRLQMRENAITTTEPLPVIDIRPVVAAVKAILERGASVVRQSTGVDGEPEPNKLGGMLLADGAISQQQLSAALEQQKRPLGQVLVDMGATSPQQVESALTKQKAGGKTGGAIKVDTERLDLLLEMVGELVIAESQVEQDESVLREENIKLQRNLNNLSKITRNLQELIMSMRMVPLRQTFQKMFRLVRDTGKKTGKEAQLTLSGEDTEIDKTIIEEIADPLVHLLRNAVDHGIEKPEDRENAGKNPEGSIALNAYHEGGNVVIEVSDDGKGLDKDKILKKALSRGLANEDEKYTDQEIHEFVFHPGLSTHDVASDISGRGVGMDVVKQNIERLGGRVEIQSEKGRGSTFRIRLPLTMAIVDGMVVKVGDDRYVLPTLGIEESIRPTQSQISTIAGRGEVIMVRGDLIQVARLSEIFSINDAVQNPCDGLIIIVDHEGKRCGIVVDELIGQQQVVIKNLGKRMKGISGVSGGCILGDGRVGLIVDIGSLMKVCGIN